MSTLHSIVAVGADTVFAVTEIGNRHSGTISHNEFRLRSAIANTATP